MTDILCSWLNKELKLERTITHDSFAQDFANGYLLGEIFHKHGLQANFDQFSRGSTSEARLNNFTRLEPTLRLLDVPFDSNLAHEVMIGSPGAATKLMYQIFIALGRKKQHRLTGPAIESMRSAAKVKLERIQTEFFEQRIKQQTPRQVDLDFEGLIRKFSERRRKRDEHLANQMRSEEEQLALHRKQVCKDAMEKAHRERLKQSEMYTRLQPLDFPKPGPASFKVREMSAQRKRKIAMETRESIDHFELTHQLLSLPTASIDKAKPVESLTGVPATTTTISAKMTGDLSYVLDIRQRMEQDQVSRREREKRRRKVLAEQLQALQQQQEANRENLLVERLMRQCVQEKRIATQLMQIRKEKEVIRNNRIMRQKQFEEQRMAEFQRALEKEAAEARLEQEGIKINLQGQLALRQKHLQERAQRNYQRNYTVCQDILTHIVDLSMKIAEYKELTENLIPAKMVRDWKILFLKGKPLYNDNLALMTEDLTAADCSYSVALVKKGRTEVLDERDLQEYMQVLNEWEPPEHLSSDLPAKCNPIISYIVYRLIDMVYPPKPPPSPPPFPKFLLKAAFIGLPLTGKTTALERIRSSMGITVIQPRELIQKAIEAYQSELAAFSTNGNGQEGSGEEGSTSQPPTPTKPEPPQFSQLGLLGQRAWLALTDGEAVDDGTLVEILLHEIRNLLDGSGWILDDFPTTLEQAQLLASGFTGQNPSVLKESADIRNQEFQLIDEREVKDEELRKLCAASGLDAVLHFTASTETVFKRGSEMKNSQHEEGYQLQHRLLAHDDNWPKLSHWYQRFRALYTINGDQDLEMVCVEVQRVVEGIITKAKQMEAMKKIGLRVDESSLSSRSLSKVATETSIPARKIKDKHNERSGRESPKIRRRRPSSANSSPLHIAHTVSSPSLKKSGKPNLGSKASITMTPKHEASPAHSVESELFVLMDPSVKPGSKEWQYCALPLSAELAVGLAGKWPAIEQTYLATLKKVFRLLRDKRDLVCHYIFDTRLEFAKFLTRPSAKQEFVSHWQKLYNKVRDDLHQESDMKKELHHRVNDLCDKLWDITDHRKSDGQEEMKRIIENQWLEDHVGLITNHYISIMQVELDKFQDAVFLLKDYYNGMENPVPPVLPDPSRLSLLELPSSTVLEGTTASNTTQDKLSSLSPEGKDLEEKGSEDKRERLSSTDREKKTQFLGAESPAESDNASPIKRRVPLLPRKPLNVEPSPPEEKPQSKKKSVAALPSEQPPPVPTEELAGLDLDSQFIVHAYNTALTAAIHLSTAETRHIEAVSAEANKPPEQTPTPEPSKDDKAAKGKKDKGKKSPAAPKKGKKTPPKANVGAKLSKAQIDIKKSESPSTPPISAEELAKKQRLEHLRKEHLAALLHEENCIKARLNLIKIKGLQVVKELKDKVTNMFTFMDESIGECYQQEVQSVNELAGVLRHAIEKEEKLIREICLPGVFLRIHKGVIMFLPPLPPSPLPVSEPVLPDQFTTTEIMSLYQNFMKMAPSGFIELQNFQETLSAAFRSLYEGMGLPVGWNELSKDQVRNALEPVLWSTTQQQCDFLFNSMSFGQLLDWRQLLLYLAQPLPLATVADLLEALQTLQVFSPDWIDKERYMSAYMWLDAPQEDGTESRAHRMKTVFFDIFKDPVREELDYMNMLLYLCSCPNSREGVLRALSLVMGVEAFQESNQPVTPQALYQVLRHSTGNTAVGISQEDIQASFDNVSGKQGTPSLPLFVLMQSPTITELINTCNRYHLPELSLVLKRPSLMSESITPDPLTSHS